MRKSGAKRVVTVIMLITTIIQFALIQPAFFFKVLSYFGLIPAVFIMPMSFICLVLYVLHLYQQWPLMLAWFKKSPDKKKQIDKTWRAVIFIALILAVVCALAFGWSEAVKSLGEGQPPPLETMRIFSWVAFVFLAIHVWQRWRLTFSYLRQSPNKKTL